MCSFQRNSHTVYEYCNFLALIKLLHDTKNEPSKIFLLTGLSVESPDLCLILKLSNPNFHWLQPATCSTFLRCSVCYALSRPCSFFCRCLAWSVTTKITHWKWWPSFFWLCSDRQMSKFQVKLGAYFMWIQQSYNTQAHTLVIHC